MSSFRKIFTYILILAGFLFGIFVFQNCVDEYSDEEVVLEVVFYDYLNHEIDPTFDNVYGLGISKGIHKVSNSDGKSYYHLPLSLHADSSVFIFEDDGNKEILGVSYKREFKFLSESQGMQVTYTDVKIMDITTFERVYIYLYNCWIGGSNECFTIEIHL